MDCLEQLIEVLNATAAAQQRVDTKGQQKVVDVGFMSFPVRCNCHLIRVVRSSVRVITESGDGCEKYI